MVTVICDVNVVNVVGVVGVDGLDNSVCSWVISCCTTQVITFLISQRIAPLIIYCAQHNCKVF